MYDHGSSKIPVDDDYIDFVNSVFIMIHNVHVSPAN